MKWLLVAFVMFAESPTPDIKINTALTFTDQKMCIDYVNRYREKLTEGLYRAFPTIVESNFTCVDFNVAKKMQRDMMKKGD